MDDYVRKIIDNTKEYMTGTENTPTIDKLFEIN